MTSHALRPISAAMLACLAVVAQGCDNPAQEKQAEAAAMAQPAVAYVVAEREIDATKAVLATVRSKKVVEARVRTPGTVASLSVTEGSEVAPGQILGVVADPKLALRIRASTSQIVAIESRLATAKAELERSVELQKRGVASQARLDQAQTAFDVATNDLAAAKAERAVIEKQTEEGNVLAPATGRVIRVPVTEGAVVMAGESLATIAANEYLLRLELPERHARFMKVGDALRVGERGLGPDRQTIAEGRIVQVYPEIQSGRVIADAEVPGLGNYFVGERTLAWISVGKRKAIVIPRDLTYNRFGLDYVRIIGKEQPLDIVVQLGLPAGTEDGKQLVEVLSGLQPGDKVVRP